jgi:hypothetical protein
VAQWVQQANGTYSLQSKGTSNNCGGAYNFIVAPSYGIQPNINYTGIRNPGTEDVDASLAKNFEIYERLRAQFRVDAWNLWTDREVIGSEQSATQCATDVQGELVRGALYRKPRDLILRPSSIRALPSLNIQSDGVCNLPMISQRCKS